MVRRDNLCALARRAFLLTSLLLVAPACDDPRPPGPAAECPEHPDPGAVDKKRSGKRVRARWGTQWYDATLVATNHCGLAKVEYDGWGPEYAEWVEADRIRERSQGDAPPKETTAPAGFEQGMTIEIEYGGTWYAGRVVEVKAPLYKVSYDDYDESWDEWVAAQRLRPVGRAAQAVEVPGQAVEVEWGGTWYAAWVLERNEQGLSRIRYQGFSETWDEWVPSRRVRPQRAPAAR